MAANFWDNSSTDGLANTAANWSLGNVPAGTDVATFDNTSDTNCLFDVSISCAGIDVTSVYDGDIDMATFNLTTTGDMTFDGTGIFDCGTGTLTCSGNFDNKDQGTWTRGTSTLVMDGAGKTITGSNSNDLNNLTTSGSITVSASTTSSLLIRGTWSNTGSLDCEQLVFIYANYTSGGDITIATGKYIRMTAGTMAFEPSSGTITSEGTGFLYGWQSNLTITAGTSTWDCQIINDYGNVNLGAGTYKKPVTLRNIAGTRTLLMGKSSSDVIIFEDDVSFTVTSAAVWTIDCGTNDVDLTFQGSVSLVETSGTINWTKGIGTITVSGSADQDVDFNDEIIEQIIIDKSGGNLKFTGGFTADFMQATGTLGAHTVDINGQTGIILAGALTFTKSANGPRFETALASTDMQNGKIKIGAASVINGYSGNQLTVENLDFDVNSQTLTATFCDIDNSDVTNLGTADATAASNTDVTPASSDNWDFGAPVGNPWYYYAQQAALTG